MFGLFPHAGEAVAAAPKAKLAVTVTNKKCDSAIFAGGWVVWMALISGSSPHRHYRCCKEEFLDSYTCPWM